MSTIFKKIIDKELPATIVYEDEYSLAFKDIQPVAPIHLLYIPKREIESLDACTRADLELLGHMMTQVPKIASQAGIAEEGYRVVTNCKEYGGQTVEHLHFHILGGRRLTWPPG